jgi:hypothetical protein
LGKVEKQAGENAGVAVAPLHGSPRPAMPVASGFFGLQGQKTKRGCSIRFSRKMGLQTE